MATKREKRKINKTMNEIINQDTEVMLACQQLEVILDRIAKLNEMEKEFRNKIIEAMQKYGVKSTEIGDYLLTYIDGIPASYTEENVLDTDKIALEYPDVYVKCLKKIVKHSNGKKASVRLTRRKKNEG